MQTLLDAKELWGVIDMSKVKPKEEDLITTITIPVSINSMKISSVKIQEMN